MSTTVLPGAHPNRGPAIIASCSITTLLALSAVAARMWVRARMIRSVGADVSVFELKSCTTTNVTKDYVILFAMALSTAGLCLIIPEVYCGAGRRRADIPVERAVMGLKINFATQPIYVIAIASIKISLALFLLRIAPSKFYRRGLLGMIIFLVSYTIVCLLEIFLQCTNLEILWDPRVVTVCWEPTTLRALSYTAGGINIATDLLFAVLPIPMLWNVQIKGRVKASIICIMGLGVL
jgi:hypothetical protein